MSGVGYFADEQLYEFAGSLPDTTELRPIDLLLAAHITASHQVMADAATVPVTTVRAVFIDEAQCRRAAPLLSAAGVEARFLGANGRLRTPS